MLSKAELVNAAENRFLLDKSIYYIKAKEFYKEIGVSSKTFKAYGGFLEFQKTQTRIPTYRKWHAVEIIRADIKRMIARDGVWSMNRYIDEAGSIHHNTIKSIFGSLEECRIALGLPVPKSCHQHTAPYKREEYQQFFETLMKIYGYISEPIVKASKSITLNTIKKNYGSLENACKEFGAIYKQEAPNRSKFCQEVEAFMNMMLGCTCIQEKRWRWLKYKNMLAVDMFYQDYGLVIEADGPQHYEMISYFYANEDEFKEAQKRDQIKNIEIPKHGLTLLRINKNNIKDMEKIITNFMINFFCAF